MKILSIAFIIVFAIGIETISPAENADTSYYLTAEAIGFGFYPYQTKGANFGLTYTDSLDFELSYVESSQDILLSNIYTSTSVFRLKVFRSPFAYFNLGIGQRLVRIRYDLATNDHSEPVELSVNSAIAELSFGTRYKSDYFIIGIDWIGGHYPFATLAKKEDYPDNADETEKKLNEDTFQNISKSTNAQFIRPYLGVVFWNIKILNYCWFLQCFLSPQSN